MLGSTGSIGTNTLNLARKFGLSVEALSCASNYELLNEQIAEFKPKFVCIADESKYVSRLGKFPLPVEVIPAARSLVARQLLKLGGEPQLRVGFITDSGNEILDVADMDLSRPLTLEDELNKITGVVENGLFARDAADVLILARAGGVEVIKVGG